ncbi:hypothetical protein ES288_D07G249300v1 [Gossypium darwinii]|uniref:DOG1 domain-containing protein n=1 Tax=Gossypium darwinii TaxID=34276 RepID=A0A5D2C022_GOSDA|nr:hypothetical protein ES288_D07G249300v1 [Gossypium darwinii]
MAPRRTGNLEMEKKQLKVRAKVKQLKAEMRKIREDQRCIREEQIKLTTSYDSTQDGVMLGILKAREGGDLVQAATLTRFLGQIVAMEKANANLAQVKDEEDDP